MSLNGQTNLKITPEEISLAYSRLGGDVVPPILSPQQLSELLGLSVKTIYEWIAKGRLNGAFRKRGKHCLIWRDRALDKIFNGGHWNA